MTVAINCILAYPVTTGLLFVIAPMSPTRLSIQQTESIMMKIVMKAGVKIISWTSGNYEKDASAILASKQVSTTNSGTTIPHATIKNS